MWNVVTGSAACLSKNYRQADEELFNFELRIHYSTLHLDSSLFVLHSSLNIWIFHFYLLTFHSHTCPLSLSNPTPRRNSPYSIFPHPTPTQPSTVSCHGSADANHFTPPYSTKAIKKLPNGSHHAK